MEADPVTWLTDKRGPTGLTQAQCKIWAHKYNYYSWAQKVKSQNLNSAAGRWQPMLVIRFLLRGKTAPLPSPDHLPTSHPVYG